MIANTIGTRNLIRRAIQETNATGVNKHTYTEKTAKKDPSRRSIVFQFSDVAQAKTVADYLKKDMATRGFKNRVKVTTASGIGTWDKPYLRVIARMA